MKLKTIIVVWAILSFFTGHTQITQTLRGSVRDQDSKMNLIGATVTILGSNPLLGSITDVNGSFRIDLVPVGRVNLLIKYVGYEEKVLPNILLTSAKEIIIDIELPESVENLETITVTAYKDKSEVINDMALISARTFSVEETQRYAGSISDPARMVSSFAGVTGNAEGNNDIVVRGNSSKGILWRLEGVEIPNPNHFANDGSTGGPVNALNSNMLSNSDFFSGAFAPEYGNALSGVFDMNFKNGNNENREYTTSASVFGIDFTAEGPFSKNYQGSFIANYRYSSLQLLSDAGILDFGGIPKYQDASFKINLPVGKKHRFSIFGLGGLSSIYAEDENEEGIRLYRTEQQSDLGILGVNHVYFINNNSYLKSFVNLSATERKLIADLPQGENDYFNYHESDLDEQSIRLGSSFNHKISANHKIETGITITHQEFDLQSSTLDFDTDIMEDDLDEAGSTNRVQAYMSWKHRVTEKLTINSGIHYLFFQLNKSQSIEPRLGVKYALSEKQSFSLGATTHSRLESPSIYLARKMDEKGNYFMPNQKLKPSKAAHLVVGYDRKINNSTVFKMEAYYQHLFNIPIETALNSTFSLLNETGYYVNEPMSNGGKGKNFGLEFTLERFFHQGFYYMSTLSLYNSRYTAQDGIERSTAFDGNYVFNLLLGKELKIGRKDKNKVMFMNTKIALIGGSRYTPIDLAESKRLGTEVRQDQLAFTQKGDDVFFINFAIGTRRNRPKTTIEFKIDINNITNNQATVNKYFLEATGEIIEQPQLPFLPNIVYSLKF